jgi:hypothetical protein
MRPKNKKAQKREKQNLEEKKKRREPLEMWTRLQTQGW